MPKSDGSVVIDTKIDTKGFRDGVADSEKILGGVASSAKKIAVIVGSAFAVGKLVDFGREAVELGSDLSEVQNVVDVTFSEMSEEVNEFAKNAITQFGLSEKSAKQYSSTMGAMLKSMGFATGDAKDMGTTLAGLAGDLASFYNLSGDDAFAKIRAGISGETEPLKQLGINLNVANLEQYALSQGITKSYSAMTQQEAALLRYNYLLSVTSDAQGDFARTSDGWANQTRILSENFNSLKATLGQGLINVFSPVIKLLNELIGKLSGTADAFRSFTASVMGSQSGAAASANSTLAGSYDDVTEAVETAEEAQKGFLTGLDEINTFAETPAAESAGTSAPTPSSVSAGAVEIDNSGIAETETIFSHITEQIKKCAKQAKKLSGIFKSGFEIGAGDARSALDGLRSDIESIGASVKSIFTSPELGASVAHFAESVSLNLGIVAGSVVRVGATIGQNLIGGVEKYVSQNSGRISEYLANVFDFGAQMSDFAGRMASTISDIFSVFGSETAQTVTGNIVGTLAETYMSVDEYVRERTLDVVNRIVGTFEENKERFKETFMTSFSALADATDAIKESVGYITGTVLPDLGDAFSWALDMLEPVKDFLVDVFFSAWNDILNPAIAKVGDAVRQATDVFKNLWENVLVPLGALIADRLSPVIDTVTFLFRNLWEHVIKPLAQFVTETFFAAWEAVCALWDNVLLPAVSKIIDVLRSLWDKTCKPLVEWFKANIYPVIGKAFEGVGSVINGLKDTMKGLLSFLTSVFKGDWKSAWETLKNVFKSIWDTLVSVVKTPINLIIGLINGMLAGIADGVNTVINAVNKMSFDVPDWVPVIGGETFGFNLPKMNAAQIPYLAKGAVIPPNAPFAAVLGDQRHGTNIEAPLDTIEEAVERVFARHENNSGRNNTYTFVAQLNRRTLFSETINEARMRQSANGRNPFELA